MSWDTFLSEIDRRIDSLDHLDYDNKELSSFKSMLQRDCAKLGRLLEVSVAGKKKRRGMTLPFMTVSVELTSLAHINETWQLRLSSRLKTIALSAGQLERMPWDEALWGTGELPGVRSQITLPADQLDPYVNGRELLKEKLQPVWAGTVSDWISVVNLHEGELLDLDDTAVMDVAFLNHHVLKLLRLRLEDIVLGAFPVGSPGDIGEVRKRLMEVKDHAVIRAGGGPFEREHASVISFLDGLLQGAGPTAKEVKNSDLFFQAVVRRSDCFIHTTVPGGTNKEDGVVRKVRKCLFGREAVALIFKTLQQRIAGVWSRPRGTLQNALPHPFWPPDALGNLAPSLYRSLKYHLGAAQTT